MKLAEIDKNKLSPMMSEYVKLKEEHPDELIFYRLGDFYELFFEDADLASRELELTLTGKQAGLDERIPMCGVPYHAVKGYLEKLVNKGYKVAICEQLEDPKYAKGIVKRGITSYYSKGTITDLEILSSKDESLIGSLLSFSDVNLLTFLDISTGKLASLFIKNNDELLINEIIKRGIKELVLVDNLNVNLINTLKTIYGLEIDVCDKILEKELLFKIDDARRKMGVKHLFYYLEIVLLKDLSHINDILIINDESILEMDVHTIRNLELVETIRLKERNYSLIWLLDKCKTAMGSRKLKNWLMNPLKDISLLNERYDIIEKLNTEFILRDELKNNLNEIYDLERLTGKVMNGSLNARDLLELKNSLKVLPNIKDIIAKLNLKYEIDNHLELYELLAKAIDEDAGVTLKDGGIIKKGYNDALDELKQIRSGGKSFIASFEKRIKDKTGIKNLKIGYNKVFGYFIEVSKGSIKDIKEEFHFERRQTLVSSERFICPELKEKEELILNAEEKIINIEYDLFIEIKEKVKKEVIKLNKTAELISNIDALVSLSLCSDEYNLVRPTLNNDKIIDIIEGRHPVIEKVSKEEYVANDCHLDKNVTTLLITGPNMSGKSTYMRQLAIIIIMAQMGSFVPAKKANLCIIDKIFTRIGASDDLVSGESTFMVEMNEARNAIINATENSLILFDELGRGTATYDGMALAKAILEYVTKEIKCFTLFSTHYHELTSLDKEIKRIKNIHVSAVEEGDKLTFLHKIKDGSVDKSYGIHVAKLAKLPDVILNRASDILNEYESQNKKNKDNNVNQLSLAFEDIKEDNIIENKIKDLDLLKTTPIEALNILYDLKENIK